MYKLSSHSPIERPYGLWESLIQPAFLSQRIRLEDVQWSRDRERLLWIETRSGTGLLVSQAPGEAFCELTSAENVSGDVGYGGGEFTSGRRGVYFAEKSGRIYTRPHDFGLPRPITPAYGSVASPVVSPDGDWLIYVYSADGEDGLAVVSLDGESWPVIAAHGADFYMQPTWSPDGRRIAWVEWDHPNMPWSGSRLMLGSFDPASGKIVDTRQAAGGASIPVFQPAFSPDGRWLSFLAGDGEEDSLCLLDLTTGQTTVLFKEIGLLPPAWIQGMRVYGWRHDGKALYLLRDRMGFASLARISLDGSPVEEIPTEPYTWLRQITVHPNTDRVACIASASGIPDQVITWDSGRITINRRSLPELIDPAEFSDPQPLDWTTPGGALVYGLFYPPRHSQYVSQGLPPAVVSVHGGPTSQTTACYNPEIGFFTNRGYGYLAVNTRGSTGYGRAYEKMLDGHWGVFDVEDTASAVHALADKGLTDEKRMVIEGKSAGGYTVCNTLIHHPGLFKAGISSFGVSDLFNLARDTHKFEAHYLDSLVGLLPDAAPRYRDWSPIAHIDRIRDALAIFQGKEDVVVPLKQSDSLVQVLGERQIPYSYHVFEGEGHGFRKTANLETFYREIDQFLINRVIFG